MVSIEQLEQPLGEVVEMPEKLPVPRPGVITGKYVGLSSIAAWSDAFELFECSHGTPEKEQVWTYLPVGPFLNEGKLAAWLQDCQRSADPLYFAVLEAASGKRCGMVSLMNITPNSLRLEIGNVWFGREYQRREFNTECAYLLLREAFDHLGYRRVEWKCDSLNEQSKAAAQRLGFTYEGTFRQHMVVKGRSRDTAWYAMLDSEWSSIKANLERWLYDNPDRKLSLTELNKANQS